MVAGKKSAAAAIREAESLLGGDAKQGVPDEGGSGVAAEAVGGTEKHTTKRGGKHRSQHIKGMLLHY